MVEMKFVLFLLCTSQAAFIPLRMIRSVSTIAASSFGILHFGVNPAHAAKLSGISPVEITKIVERDITQNQALITADFTRDIYDESCTFTDEIDTYQMDKYIQGTKALFRADKSHVDLPLW